MNDAGIINMNKCIYRELSNLKLSIDDNLVL